MIYSSAITRWSTCCILLVPQQSNWYIWHTVQRGCCLQPCISTVFLGSICLEDEHHRGGDMRERLSVDSHLSTPPLPYHHSLHPFVYEISPMLISPTLDRVNTFPTLKRDTYAVTQLQHCLAGQVSAYLPRQIVVDVSVRCLCTHFRWHHTITTPKECGCRFSMLESCIV